MQGQICFYNDERGFGFIKTNHEQDCYFHIESVENNEEKIAVGSLVEFDERIFSGRKRATRVKILPSTSKQRSSTDGSKKFFKTADYAGEFLVLSSNEIDQTLIEISNWKLEAKLEDTIRYFLPMPEVGEILRGRRSYVIGRKGTGKSAIVSHLYDISDKEIYTEKLSFKNFPFNDLYDLNDSHFTKPNQYITLWKYIIYSSIVQMMGTSKGIDKKIRKKIHKVYPERDVSDLKGLLRKWTSGDFSISVLGHGFSFANWFSKKVESSWMERVDRLEGFVAENCDEATYLVLFDELDEDYKEMMTQFINGGYIHLLTSLFKAVQDIRSVMGKYSKNIYPVIFLRDDIYDLITDADKTKWLDLTTRLDWTIPEIQKLLKYRIEKAANTQGLGFNPVWHSIFDVKSVPYANRKKSLHSFDYITRSTQGRPRDFIHYLQVCAESQLENGGGKISAKTILSADKAYSNYLKSELIDEIHGVIPDINTILRIFTQIRKWILTIDEFRRIYRDYVDRQIIETKDPDFVLQTLFYFSVIGNVSRQRNYHIFRHEHSEAVLNFHENIVIHRGLMKSLQII